MYNRPYGLSKTPPSQTCHSFDRVTDFCTQCGAHRSSIWLGEWPQTCPAGPNVVGISHLLAQRYIAEATRAASQGNLPC